jgi:hypothetical protein
MSPIDLLLLIVELLTGDDPGVELGPEWDPDG